MSDMSGFLKLMKQSSVEAVENTQPSTIVFGIVTALEPLEITVEQRLVLGMSQLILSRNVTEYIQAVSMEWASEMAGDVGHTHSVDVSTGPDGDPSHTHGATATVENVDMSHRHEVLGEKELVIHNGLQLGEMVLLLRMQGGQKFLVLDRVAEESQEEETL